MSVYQLAYPGSTIDTKLGYIDQDIKTTASPTFVDLTLTGTLLSTAITVTGGNIDQTYSLNGSSLITSRNDTDGTSSTAGFRASYNGTAQNVSIHQYANSYTTNGMRVANSVCIFASGNSNGLRLFSYNAGSLYLGTNNTVALTINTSQNATFAGNVDLKELNVVATGLSTHFGIDVALSGDNAYTYSSESLAANLTGGNRVIHMFGQSAAAGNAGYIGFSYTGNNSASNYVTIGIYSNNDLFKLDKSGNLVITGTFTAAGQIKSGDGTNYATLDDDGLRLGGTYTCWEDLRVPLQQSKTGATNKPDYNYTNLTYDFPQNDTTEILYITVQMPHGWKEGTDINPHIHWIQTQNLNVTWKIDYRWFNPNAAVPAGFTTLTIDQLAFSYSSGSLHQISAPSAMISGSGYTLSSILQIKLYRDDNTYTGDALAMQFDIHYQKDAIGSGQEYAKDN